MWQLVIVLIIVQSLVNGFQYQMHNHHHMLIIRKALFAVHDINSGAALDDAVKSVGSGLLVVDYSTTWCGPCKLVAPKFEKLSTKYPEIPFYKCIGDTSSEATLLMKREGVRSVPTFHFWKNGARVEIVNGARIDDIESTLKSLK